MKRTRLLIAACASIAALGSVVALAQTAPQEAASEAYNPPSAASADVANETLPNTVAAAPATSTPEPIEDAPVDVPATSQNDWAPDINLDALPKDTSSSNGYVRRVKPRKNLSDAGEDMVGSGSWSQGHASASAQAELLARATRRERPLDPLKRSDLTKLSRIMGALHALRVSCEGRDDQTYRSRMATMLDLEAPGNGDLRDPLVDAFNGGFQAYGRGASVCPTDRRAQEANLAKDGHTLARALSERYRPVPLAAKQLPPASQPRQNGANPSKMKQTDGRPPAVASATNARPPAQETQARPSWEQPAR
jgi:uncharacterized protein (TIGR02301 family)